MKITESKLRRTIRRVIRESVMSKVDAGMQNIVLSLVQQDPEASAMSIKSELQSMGTAEIGALARDHSGVEDDEIAHILQGEILDLISSATSEPWEHSPECPLQQHIEMLLGL